MLLLPLFHWFGAPIGSMTGRPAPWLSGGQRCGAAGGLVKPYRKAVWKALDNVRVRDEITDINQSRVYSTRLID